MFTQGRPRIEMLVGVPLVALALLLSACGSKKAAADVASLSNGEPAAASPTTSPANSQEMALKFVDCLREQGLDVPDPKFDADGNLSGRVLGTDSEAVRQDPTVRAALAACRDRLGNVRFGDSAGGRSRPSAEVLQAAFNDYTSCLRREGLDVDDITLNRPQQGSNRPADGASGPGGGSGGGGNGRRSGFERRSDAQAARRTGEGFDPTTRLLRRLNLDLNDPAVKSATDTCQPVLSAAFADSPPTTAG